MNVYVCWHIRTKHLPDAWMSLWLRCKKSALLWNAVIYTLQDFAVGLITCQIHSALSCSASFGSILAVFLMHLDFVFHVPILFGFSV
jgi:hypothetical protein